MQHLTLQFQQERVSLNRVVEEKCEVQVRARRHLCPAGAAQRDHSKGLFIAQRPLLLLRPLAGKRRVNSRAHRGNRPAIV